MPSYAGIGSRKTPKKILDLMLKVGWDLALLGYTLRSGGAEGADTAFEEGSLLGGELGEIYLPWPGFNDHGSKVWLSEPSEAAIELSSRYHPSWYNLSREAKKLHGRNAHQVLGLNLDDPADFVICWTPRAKVTGGTGQALRIAADHDVEVLNLADPDDLAQVQVLVDS